MIVGIGVDSVEVHRFLGWHTYSQKTLRRIFSENEIAYCLQNRHKSAERFAARFAAREAFFKAASSIQSQKRVPFLTLCKLISVEKCNERPILLVDWNAIFSESFAQTDFITCHLSLTHTEKTATAFAVLEKE